MPIWSQMSFQDPMTPIMAKLAHFHDHMLLVMMLVMTVIGYALLALCSLNLTHRYIKEAQEVETIWTIAPAMILVSLALPSIQILYIMDEALHPSLTLKATGHQWYWSYEYSDLNNVEFDSYMTPTSDLTLGDYRLLEVDNRIVLPTNLEIRIILTAADVIHSWTIPSLGVKLDAVPGRLNQAPFTLQMAGVFYGQCSEICGINHSFMPIALEAVPLKNFMIWLNKH